MCVTMTMWLIMVDRLQVRPRGPTPTGKRVNDILDAYMSTLRHDRDMKPLNLVVITDGEASDNWLLVRSTPPSASCRRALSAILCL